MLGPLAGRVGQRPASDVSSSFTTRGDDGKLHVSQVTLW
jgi:hypothetical protein